MVNAPEEILIKDWDHFCDVCNKLEGYGQDTDDTVVFRGHQDATWEFKPSLYREILTRKGKLEEIYEIEKESITAFVEKWFPAQMKSYMNHNLLFQMLSIMQHYGMKTRMLDWTLSWLIAAYFATENAYSNDAAVWSINKTQIEKRFKRFCGEEYVQMCLRRGISSLNDYNLCRANADGCPVKQPDNRIQCNAIFFKDAPSTSTDVRMIIQASIFTYCPNPLADHIKCVAEVLGEDTEKYCKKMIIDKKLKPQFREQLKTTLESPGKEVFPIISQEDNKGIFEEIIRKYAKKSLNRNG